VILRIVARAVQVGSESADNEKTMDVCGFHGLYGTRRNLLVVHGFSAPRGFAFLLFPCVELGKAAVVVVSQALEVGERDAKRNANTLGLVTQDGSIIHRADEMSLGVEAA
jgi:hypothetical protein